MNRVWGHFREYWPAWFVIAFVALMPFRRLMEIPLSLFAFSLFLILRDARHRATLREVLPFTGALFLCFWIPAWFSLADSYLPDKTYSTVLYGWRYGAAALAMGVWLRPARQRALALKGCAFVLLFWAVDGGVQALLGTDLLGIARHPERLNGLFNDRYQFFGPMLAMLSPLPIEYARRHWPRWALAVVFGLLWGIVLVAGMRAGWLAMGVVTGVYVLVMLQSRNPAWRRVGLVLPLVGLVMAGVLYTSSDMVRERLDLSLKMLQGTEAAFDEGSSYRLPLWRAAVRMFEAHPVTGVGVRAFPIAYKTHAPPDDPHQIGGSVGKGGAHAHNIILEVMAEAGVLGLVGLLLTYVIGWGGWLKATRASRREALPWALVVFGLTFPFTSHFAIYGVTTSSAIWMFVGLWGASLRWR